MIFYHSSSSISDTKVYRAKWKILLHDRIGYVVHLGPGEKKSSRRYSGKQSRRVIESNRIRGKGYIVNGHREQANVPSPPLRSHFHNGILFPFSRCRGKIEGASRRRRRKKRKNLRVLEWNRNRKESSIPI